MTEINGGYTYTTNYEPKGAESTHEVKEPGHISRRSLIAGVGGALALSVLLTACGPNGEPVPTPTTSETPTDAPTQTPEQLKATIEIKAGLNSTELAKTIEQRMVTWQTGLATPATNKESDLSNKSTINFVDEKYAIINPIYEDALFVATAKTDHGTASNIASIEYNGSAFLDWYLITSHDAAPFSYSGSVSDVISKNGTLSYIVTEHNNSALNRIGTKYAPSMVALDGHKYGVVVKTIVVNGVEKIVTYNTHDVVQ